MHNAIQPKPWDKVCLAILPGLWITVWQSEIFNQFPREIGSAILVVIALGVIRINLVTERRLAAWSLPALGGLLWAGWEWLRWLINTRSLWVPWYFRFHARFGPLYARLGGIDPVLPVWFVFLAVLILGTYLSYKKSGLRVSWSGWGVLGLSGLVFVAWGRFIFPAHWLSAGIALSLLLLLASVAWGFPLSKREGLAAGLLVIVCQPVAFDMLLFNFLHIIRVYAYDSPDNMRLRLTLFVLSILPFLCFLVIIPIGVLRSRSRQSQQWWLLLASLITLTSMIVVRSLTLQGTPNAFSLDDLIRYGLGTLQLWLPILFMTVSYLHSLGAPQVSVTHLEHTPEPVSSK